MSYRFECNNTAYIIQAQTRELYIAAAKYEQVCVNYTTFQV